MKLAPGAEVEKGKASIFQTTLDDLIHDQNKLRALERGGVDNWEGYDSSMQEAGLFDTVEIDDEVDPPVVEAVVVG